MKKLIIVIAASLLLDLEVGNRIWFKRVNDNGTVKPVATSTPC